MNALPVDAVRPYASMGARGLLRVGSASTPPIPATCRCATRLLDRYDERVCVESRLFPGMAEVLAELVQRRIAWGIVTNKSSRFTPRIVEALQARAGVHRLRRFHAASQAASRSALPRLRATQARAAEMLLRRR
jgi:phosphoglycolate phosphatase-like HAD superfamily hydrolase